MSDYMVKRSRLRKKAGRKKPTRLKKSYEYFLTQVPNAYGFGRDYTLNIRNVKTGELKRYWLGQDVKVFSRILGMDMSYAIDHYSKKANSKDFDKIQKFVAEDIIKTVTGKDEVTQEDLEKIIGEAQGWSFAVQ